MVRFALLAAVLACVLGCNGKKAAGPVKPTGGDAAVAVPQGDPAECDALADQIAGLYRAELTDPIDGEVEDATSMILTDCRQQPGRLAPCIRDAKSVAVLERDCVIPLDEAGTVEGKRGGAAPR